LGKLSTNDCLKLASCERLVLHERSRRALNRLTMADTQAACCFAEPVKASKVALRPPDAKIGKIKIVTADQVLNLLILPAREERRETLGGSDSNCRS
jgi:hypothetical protein